MRAAPEPTDPAVPPPRTAPAEALRARLARWIVLAVAKGLFRFRLEVVGQAVVPAGEPLIVAAAPHRNWVDGFLLVMALPPTPRPLFVATAPDLFNTWWKRAMLWAFGGVVPVEKTGGGANRAAIEASLAALAAGHRLVIFPEGWHHVDDPDGVVGDFQRGVAFLAGQSRRRVLPVGLNGTGTLWRGKTLPVRLGAPVTPPQSGAPRSDIDAWTERLREATVALVPPAPPEPAAGRKPWPWLTTLLD